MTQQEEIKNNNKYIPLLNAGFVGLVDHMGDDSSIVQAARVSYGKGTKKVSEDRGLIRYLVRHSHTTPLEMVEFKFHCISGNNRIDTELGLLKVQDSLNAKIVFDTEKPNDTVVVNTGNKEIFQIVTEKGYKFEVTEDHLITVLDSSSGLIIDKKLKEINSEDYITISNKPKWFGGQLQSLPEPRKPLTHKNRKINFPKILNEELAELLGFFLGDGTQYKGLEFPVGYNYESTKERVVYLLKNLFEVEPQIIEKQNENIFRIVLHSVILDEWWSNCGFSKINAHNIKVPDLIWKSPKNIIEAFIRGLFTADGSVSKTNGITYTTVCRFFSDEIKLLLQSLGVLTNTLERNLNGYSHKAYEIYTISQESIENYKKIRFFDKEKNRKLDALSSEILLRTESIPNQVKVINNIWNKKQTTYPKSKTLFTEIYNNCKLKRRKILEGINKGYLIPESAKYLNYFYDKIKKQHSLGTQSVYDLTVPSTEHFVINGAIVHNCKMPIFVARQWIRHRTASVNEYSGRYSEMSEDMFVPDLNTIMPQSDTNKQGRSGELNNIDRMIVHQTIERNNILDQKAYQELLSKNLAKEMARGVLSVNNYTEWIWKIDLHNLFHFLKLRLDAHAQYEIRVFAEAMYELIKPIVPTACEAFEDYVMDIREGTYQNYVISKFELDEIRDFIAYNVDQGQDTQCFEINLKSKGLSKREIDEFFRKFQIKKATE